MEWRVDRNLIRAALAWEADPPAPELTSDQEAYLLAQGYVPVDTDSKALRIRANARDDRLLAGRYPVTPE